LGDAISLFEQTLADAERSLGDDHPRTAAIRAGRKCKCAMGGGSVVGTRRVA
jgi:hypothetical protein